MRNAWMADNLVNVGWKRRHHCFCRCGDLCGEVRAPTRGWRFWGTYDALLGAYRGGIGRRHNWLVTETEKRVVGLIEITA